MPPASSVASSRHAVARLMPHASASCTDCTRPRLAWSPARSGALTSRPVRLTALAVLAYRRILRISVAGFECRDAQLRGWPGHDRRAALAAQGHGPRTVARLQRPHERVVLTAAGGRRR